jgi:hypothetical protein
MDQGLTFKFSPIVRNAAMDKQLAEQGYYIFPLLDEATVKRISDYYFEFQKEEPAYFYSSTHSSDFEFRKKTSEFIKQQLAPLLPGELNNYRLLGGAFVVKPPHGKGMLQPHQDWNLVDETLSRSYNIWIPLVDVTPENGAVFVLNGSHNKLQSYRGPGIPALFKNVESLIWERMLPLNMKAGEALLYDHALLHGSPPNKSANIRLGIVAGVIPAGVEMQLNFWNNGSVDVYRIDESFFLSADPSKAPGTDKKINTIENPRVELDETSFKKIFLGEVAPEAPATQSGFFRKLLSKIKL